MRYTPRSELYQRVQRLQVLLQNQSIDGALIVQNADLFYFAGTVQQAHLYIPAGGEPVLAVKKNYERAARESALENIIPLDNPKNLTKIIPAREQGGNNRIGLELDVLPANLFLRYQKMFQPAELVDISLLIRTVRAVKSSYELNLIREAAKLNHKLFTTVSEFLKEGISEVELAGKLEAVYRREGHQCLVRTRAFNMELAYGHLMSGWSLGVPSAAPGPTGGFGLNPSFSQSAGRKLIGRDEPVIVDYVGVIDGYMVDQARVFCIGDLPPKFKEAHNTALEIQQIIVERAKPGAVCGELYDLAVQRANASGWGEYFMGYPDPVPFVGHGVGIELDELPVIARGVTAKLEAGMVFALEPKFVFPDGAAGIENTFVVTEQGLENLTAGCDDVIIYL
ncbi:Xaa-Pro aminopeptidase [Desulfotomaculum arcticum]|uniref:Xaa-Pro aminopeptidase n=1 Tax=Desulfotruncus arcticus DSM 17038 TaxID=1121424 RepID=A0A1I2UJM0_9FIRM|nr:Xaa-Pro peptidase family protein [Desulfotruncus arcticus]SFG77364.1 Xaa-Pro aminopeptidase [Desulfotomaculum arcticum] [Desulfotruncus arcticus DSM 17038]